MAGLLPLDFAFRAKYKVESCWPEDLEYAKFPIFAFNENGPREYDTKVSASLIIRPDEDEPWAVGLDGDMVSEQATGIYACPDPNCFLAVVDSWAYYIDSTTPGGVTVLPIYPVRKIYSCVSFDMLFALEFASMTAIGPTGIMWSTKRLVVDELSITRISEEVVHGCGDFHRDDENLFVLDRLTGKVLRGNIFCEE